MLRIVTRRFEHGTEPTIDVDPNQIINTEKYRNGDIEVQYWEEVTESYICGYEKDDGERCQISVSAKGDRCHHHE